MIINVPFSLIHLDYLEVQDDQAHIKEFLQEDWYRDLLLTGGGRTVIHDGTIVGCGGVFPMTDYMGRAWAILSRYAGPAMLPTARIIRDFLHGSDYGRIDTPVRRDFVNGHRLCRVIGFENETKATGMRKYGFNGETYDLYALFPKEHTHGKPQPLQETKSPKT